jgi:agmatine deiminase
MADSKDQKKAQGEGVSPLTPGSLGFRMPAEWETHAATWVAWPHNPNDWPGKFQPIAWIFADIVKNLARAEICHILVNNGEDKQKALKVLEGCGIDLTNIRFHVWPTNRIWTRDSGAIFVRDHNDEIAVTDWKFNAWAKYNDWQLDNKIAGRMAKYVACENFEPVAKIGDKEVRLVLEGGSIDTNGQGTLLTTEECLLSEVQARNPQLAREDYERVFAEYLGIDQVIWLKKGIVGDDTHGHVDDISRFVAPDMVVTVVEENRADENYYPLRDNLEILRTSTDLHGRRLRVKTLPMPAPVVFKGQRLPASYANFYIANDSVLVPVFNDPNDRVALNTMCEIYPSRRIVPIYCGDFIWGLGAIHCMTQQQPAGKPYKKKKSRS